MNKQPCKPKDIGLVRLERKRFQILVGCALFACNLAIGASGLSAQSSADGNSSGHIELKEVKLEKEFVLMVDTSAENILTAGFLPRPLPFKEASLIKVESERLYVFLFCAYSCRPDPGGYWAWVQIPFSQVDPEQLQIVTTVDPLLHQTNVRVQREAGRILLKITFVTTQGCLNWRERLIRAGLGRLLDPANTELAPTRDAVLKVK